MRARKSSFPERAVVACQGTEGAYSQFACDRMFKYPEIMYVNSFDSVFEAVGRGLCRYGILPLENSTAGSVTAVYELMQKHKFYIVGSIKLCISHSLLAAPGVRLDGVKEIFSHEQAINQCSKFLSELKDVKITVCANTAEAGKVRRRFRTHRLRRDLLRRLRRALRPQRDRLRNKQHGKQLHPLHLHIEGA